MMQKRGKILFSLSELCLLGCSTFVNRVPCSHGGGVAKNGLSKYLSNCNNYDSKTASHANESNDMLLSNTKTFETDFGSFIKT